MKKVFVVFAVLALTMAMASVALAEVTFDGSIEFLMRSLENTNDWDSKRTSSGDYQDTRERLRFGINAKHENVKGRIQLENDWDRWADGSANPSATDPNGANPGFEKRMSSDFYPREAWIDFNMPFGVPGHIKVGRQFLQLGNGWFFRSGKYGSDAWVVGFPGQNTVAFVNVKAAENETSLADDTDAYVLLDTYKLDDKNSVGIYLVHVNDRAGTWTDRAFANDAAGINVKETKLNTIGLHYSGVVGPISLKAELDIQSGKITTLPTATQLQPDETYKLSGNQIVIQAGMNMDALAVRATLAQGSGDKVDEDVTPPDTGLKLEGYLPFLDQDPHYTLVYEYFMVTAAGAQNTGFSNTRAISVGADFKVNNMITVGADIWNLSAVEKVALNGGPESSSALGNEVDVKVNLKLTDQLTWNTTVGYFMPGKAYDSTDANGDAKSGDTVQAIQSVLSYKF